MNAERWREVERVLDRALDSDPASWESIVADACGTDPELRREVEELLAAYSRPAGILDADRGEVVGAIAVELVRERGAAMHADALVGARLGPWRVVRRVGHGGMSHVFLGERCDGAFEQRVAIKVLRAGLDTAADTERFRIERQILASLDHPNIARLLDGGVAPDGRPYLVLEYIEGEPLTTYCDARALDVAARLRLFLAVAEATQSAHRQLVVHRDLKPSNILVAADGRPRLLDFGVAKILDPAQDGTTGATATRRRWLTPEYAAPEQFSGAPVTTATDVWQLGAVLYELLAGHRPFEPRAGDRIPLEERVCRDDPAPPSSHRRALRGDLDAVVLRALRKEPAARYASVAELAADVRRYLDGEPVAARAGERAYRWRRLARRRALPLSIAAAAVAIVGVYVGTLRVQNRRIARAFAEATVERQKAEQVTEFLLGLFRANDPRAGRSDTITARALLARGEARADMLARQPAVQAELLDVIGRIRHDVGALAEARPSLERALAIRRRLHGDSHPDVAESLVNLAALDQVVGRSAEAERGFRRALAIQRASVGDSADAAIETLFMLGYALHARGKYGDAGAVLAEWERLVARRPRRRDDEHARRLAQLGQLLHANGQRDTAALARAERLHREALAIRLEVFGPRHAEVASSAEDLAAVLREVGRLEESDSLYREAVATLRALYPDGHPDLAFMLVQFASTLRNAGRFEEALPLFREGIDMTRRYLGDDHVDVSAHRALYAEALRRQGDHAAAEPVFRAAIAGFARHLGEHNLMAERARVNLADVLHALGRTREAEALLLAVYARFSSARGVGSPHTQFALRRLVQLYDGMGRPADAARYRALLVTPPASGRAPPSPH